MIISLKMGWNIPLIAELTSRQVVVVVGMVVCNCEPKPITPRVCHVNVTIKHSLLRAATT